jgi:hypothetical protein
MISNFTKKKNLIKYLHALDKLNKRFSRLTHLVQLPLSIETIERDYSKLIKAIFYCQMKVKKSYNLKFITSLSSKLKNKIFVLKQHLITSFIQELKLLQKNSNRNVTYLFHIIKKFYKLEVIAKEFLKEFGYGSVTDTFFFENDVNLLKNSIEQIKRVQRSLMRSETEDYIMGIKSKIEAKRM